MQYILIYQSVFKLLLPEIFLGTSILILTIYSTLLVKSKHYNFPLLNKNLIFFSIFILILVFFLTYNTKLQTIFFYKISFIFDYLAIFSKMFIIAFSILIFFFINFNLKKNQINHFEYFILLLSAILGLLLLVSSNDFLSLYLSLEMQSLCLYALAASKKNSSFSIESGLKYFILGSFSSALLLFGISLLYACTGTIDFHCLFLLFSENNISLSVYHSLFFIIVAFFFKLAVAPFHMWAPDVYEGAPTSSTFFFIIAPKISLFVALLRILHFFIFLENFITIISFLAICSLFIGSLGALKQKKLKRLFAYSSIGHVGYMLLSFSVNSLESIQSLFFYLIIYLITNVILWGLLFCMETNENLKRPKTLIDLSFFCKLNSSIAFTALISCFSIAGIPPLAGFYAKFFIFKTSINASLYLVSLLAILISIIASFYYIRLIKNLYFEKSQKIVQSLYISKSISYSLSFFTFMLFYFFINPNLLFLITQIMALTLF